jgi:D-alanyl-D-alanine carboxypeptidase
MFDHKAALLAIALAACSDSTSPPDAGSEDSTIKERLQQHLDALHAAGIVGVVGEVRDGDRQIWARSGVAQLDGNDPIAVASHVRIGSNTKTFVAVVVLQLVHEGVVALDDSVDRWLPGQVSGNGHDGTRITIRDLLQHTSGLEDYTPDVFAEYTPDNFATRRFQHYDPEELVAIALRHPPRFAPGTGWTYSNTNTVLAGMIIEKATGRDWRAEVNARIVVPLGLSNTFTPLDEPDLPPPFANGYHRFAEGAPLLDVTLMNHSLADAAGSIISTTSDVVAFWRALQGGQLLGATEMAEMHASMPVNDEGRVRPGSRYGLGIIWYPTSCGGGYWHHQGDTLGFSNFNAVSDDGTRAVVVAQTTTGIPAADAESYQLLDDVMCAGR